MLTLATFLEVKPGMLQGKYFRVSHPSALGGMCHSAAGLKLLLKAAVDAASESLTRAGTFTPLSCPPNPGAERQKVEGGEGSSFQPPLSLGCS